VIPWSNRVIVQKMVMRYSPGYDDIVKCYEDNDYVKLINLV